MSRWVRYETPIMVCVAVDDEGERVINVVVGEDAEDIRLARNPEGQPLVYDEHMELLDPNDPTAQCAVREAEDRQWPDAVEWEGGPDALRFPGLYDPVELDEDEDDDEDLDPLHLDDTRAAQTS
jgi:hypothetical protein